LKYSSDIILGTEGWDFLYGDSEGEITEGRGGNDVIFGLGGTGQRGAGDALYGDALTLSGTARGGSDWLFGEAGPETLMGDAVTLLDRARGGDDIMYGGEGSDALFGEGFEMLGTARGGDDVLIGGRGDDQLWGDASSMGPDAKGGNDTFVFAGTFGDDRIGDFRQGEDRLLFAFVGADDLGDLAIEEATSGPPDETGTLIKVDGFGTVTLTNFTGTLTAADVMFI
jgi:Ca2+-binding RTX toxin-like protein